MKKLLATLSVFAFLFAMTASAFATDVYLKGTGNPFGEEWNNVFYMTEEVGETPNVWHIVYTGGVDTITAMQLEFTNGEVFTWEPDMGFSVNGGGNNPGWIIVAPYDWFLAYKNTGNKNDSGCVLTTTEKEPGQFNISGFNKGEEDGHFSGYEPEFSFWAIIHYDVEGIGSSTATVNDPNATIGTEHNWFTGIYVDGITRKNVMEYTVVNGKKLDVKGWIQLSLDENYNLVITTDVDLDVNKLHVAIAGGQDNPFLAKNTTNPGGFNMNDYIVLDPESGWNKVVIPHEVWCPAVYYAYSEECPLGLGCWSFVE